MPNHPAGSEVAAATYRVLGWLGRMVPPWRPIRVVPEGLCSWGDLWKVSLLNGAAWQLPMGLRLVPDHGRIARLAGAAVQAGEIRCPGMDAATGRMVWIPAAAWRTTPTYGGAALPPERAAITGRLLRIPGDPGVVVEPLLPLRDLALFLGAANPPPPPPRRVLDAIEEPGAGRRSRRRDDDGDPAPAFPDARETVSEAGGDPWRQEDDASVFGHGRPMPSGSGSPDVTIRPRTGSDPLNAGAWGATAEGLVDEVRDDGPEPAPRSPPAAHGPGPMDDREAVEVPPDGCAGRPADSGSGADASPTDESGWREPPGQPDTGEAGRGRVVSAEGGRYDGATTVGHGPLAAGTGSAPMAFGTGSNAAREARVGRKTGSPAQADHLLFPRVQEWMEAGRRFATVTDLCGQLASWLEEAHGKTMQPGSIEGALRKRGKSLLDEICPPAPVSPGTLPNGRPRASPKTARN